MRLAEKGQNFKGKYFTSESVTEGHPDKLADRISDAVLDHVLEQDPTGRVGCETLVTTGCVVVGGEISTKAHLDIQQIIRQTIKEVGYKKAQHGFNWQDCAILTSVDEQSEDISKGIFKAQRTPGAKGKVDYYNSLGAGDQGIVYGYACQETKELMPLPITLAHGLTKKLSKVRKNGLIPYLEPDGKSQVTIEYNDHSTRVRVILLAVQHDEAVTEKQLEKEIRTRVINPVLDHWMDKKTKVLVNPSGRFVKGGPAADTGMTGRKMIADTYGGYGSHGGGALSGKDPTKVDRSGSYMARYVAKNIVAASLASECEVQVAYAIGKASPLALTVNTFGTGKIREKRLQNIVKEIFDFRPAAIIDQLDLRRPIYTPLSCYGHFGRDELNLPWEQTDKVKELKLVPKRIKTRS